jgi:hypothetical protein
MSCSSRLAQHPNHGLAFAVDVGLNVNVRAAPSKSVPACALLLKEPILWKSLRHLLPLR